MHADSPRLGPDQRPKGGERTAGDPEGADQHERSFPFPLGWEPTPVETCEPKPPELGTCQRSAPDNQRRPAAYPEECNRQNAHNPAGTRDGPLRRRSIPY